MNKLFKPFPNWHLLLLVVCITASGLRTVNAYPLRPQQSEPIAAQRTPRIRPQNWIPNSCNPEFRTEKLTGLVEMPGLSTYSGKLHFISGIEFPNAKGGASATMKFATTALRHEVLDWYRSAFKQSGWLINKDMTNEARIGAMSGKQICQVLVLSPARVRYPGDRTSYRSDVVLRYKF
jgi:hypothetical protein